VAPRHRGEAARRAPGAAGANGNISPARRSILGFLELCSHTVLHFGCKYTRNIIGDWHRSDA
jgi:hypothetical protein